MVDSSMNKGPMMLELGGNKIIKGKHKVKISGTNWYLAEEMFSYLDMV